MWALAVSIFGGLKWLTLASSAAAQDASLWRIAGYLFLWPGLNADRFLRGSQATTTTPRELFWAAAKVTAGAMILSIAVPRALALHPLAAGWLGMLGLVLILHFGIFHLLSLAWRSAGIVALPLMNRPLAAHSLSDFWSCRWNVAFRDVAHRFVIRSVAPRLGIVGATLAVFLISGVVHDLVISLPVGAGYGRPTLYFVLQSIAVLFERSPLGQRAGFGDGWPGRVFAAGVLLLPVPLLFHPPFVLQAILPTLRALGVTS
jgi:alginate O-acetyltransferase complex protein AlgI